MKHSIVDAAKWIVAGVGAVLAWIAIVSSPKSEPGESPPDRKS